MYRKEKIDPNLAGTEYKLIKRRLVGVTMKVTSKKAYKTADIPVNGQKVVGLFVYHKRRTDEPIVVYTRYYGVGVAGQTTEAFIKSLNSEPMPTKYGEVTVNAGVGEKIYIAQPQAAGMPIIEYNGFQGGFNDPTTVNVTDPVTGAVVPYYLFESINENLGQTTLEIS